MEGQDGWQVVQVVADDTETERRLRSTWSPPAGALTTEPPPRRDVSVVPCPLLSLPLLLPLARLRLLRPRLSAEAAPELESPELVSPVCAPSSEEVVFGSGGRGYCESRTLVEA